MTSFVARRAHVFSTLAVLTSLCSIACGSGGGGDSASGSESSGSGAGAGSSGTATQSGGVGGSLASAGNAAGGSGQGNGSSSSHGQGGSCAATTAQGQLEPVHLFFIMDESGSMGDGQHGNIDEKWNPVVAALKSFFADPLSEGLQATMTLFPPDANKTTGPAQSSYLVQAHCEGATYATPSVPMTALPNGTAFGAALDAVTPPNEYGTPTRPAVRGMILQVQSFLGAAPGSKVAMVLVTDGEPIYCDNNTVQTTAGEIASVASTVPTYVIGVGPALDSLNALASAGGTGQAFLVEVGNPAKTQADFLNAINTVRGALVPCDVAIPPAPAGQTLDPKAVNVDIVTGDTTTPLGYNQECTGGAGWRYDDPSTPTRIIFCDATCETVKKTPGVKVEFAFGCEQRVEVPK